MVEAAALIRVRSILVFNRFSNNYKLENYLYREFRVFGIELKIKRDQGNPPRMNNLLAHICVITVCNEKSIKTFQKQIN